MTDAGARAPDPATGEARSRSVLIGAAEMAEIDEAAHRLGISPDALMESAGAAVAEVAFTELARLAEPVVGPGGPLAERLLSVVLCGTGNNGGDGFVVARRLAAGGQRVVAVLVGEASRIAGPAAAHNWMVIQAMASAGSLELFEAPTADLLAGLRARLSPASLIVDALLGSGASGPLREPVASAVQLANAIRTHAVAAGRPCRVLAVDTPTLVDLTSGDRSDPVVAADVTVNFHRADGEYPPARITEVTWSEPVLP
jgi:NAD(P)H-hydrate epimerase